MQMDGAQRRPRSHTSNYETLPMQGVHERKLVMPTESRRRINRSPEIIYGEETPRL